MLDNHLNPLMLRELRQNVRNNITVLLINVFIGVMVFSSVMYVVFSSDTGGGRWLFATISGITSGACLIIVVLFSAFQTGKQRVENDLMFTSALSPWSQVAGKWLAGAVMTLLLLSLSAPFIAVAYLLRGIDIQTILLSFIITFLLIQLTNSLGISIAVMPKTPGLNVILIAAGIIPAMYAGAGIVALPVMLSVTGTSATFSGEWIIFLIIFTISSLCLTLLFLLIAAAALSPPTSNRVLPVRIMLTVVFFLSILLMYFVGSYTSFALPLTDMISIWFGTCITILISIFILTVHERAQWCYRIRRTIPQNILLRFLCFPFYTGAPCGILWSMVIFGIALAVLIHACVVSTPGFDLDSFVCLAVFAFDYCVTALLISSMLDPHRRMPIWALILILLMAFTFGSFILAFLIFAPSFDFLGHDFYNTYTGSVLSALNPFMLTDKSYYSHVFMQWAGAMLWFVILCPFFVIWFFRKIQNFSPAGKDDAMTLEQAITAVPQSKENVR
ncbi:MAG: hypothetical protein FWE67_01810 [Planctomycetaceae bacterium]|nr:hypothetical protein [Planctomycetaceae bacterium]